MKQLVCALIFVTAAGSAFSQVANLQVSGMVLENSTAVTFSYDSGLVSPLAPATPLSHQVAWNNSGISPGDLSNSSILNTANYGSLTTSCAFYAISNSSSYEIAGGGNADSAPGAMFQDTLSVLSQVKLTRTGVVPILKNGTAVNVGLTIDLTNVTVPPTPSGNSIAPNAGFPYGLVSGQLTYVSLSPSGATLQQGTLSVAEGSFMADPIPTTTMVNRTIPTQIGGSIQLYSTLYSQGMAVAINGFQISTVAGTLKTHTNPGPLAILRSLSGVAY